MMEVLGSVSAAAALLLALPALAQEPRYEVANEHLRMALPAYEKKDFKTYADRLEKAIQAGVRHPAVLYRLAGANALKGDREGWQRWLGQLADWGLSFEAESDPDFASARGTPEFEAVLQRFAKNLAPTDNSQIAFTLPDRTMIPEGIAYDAQHRSFFFGIVNQRKIVRLDEKGALHDFATRESGLWSVLGMCIDGKRGILWAASTAFEGIGDTTQVEKGRSGLFAFDLTTGRLRGAYPVPTDGREHGLGDVIVDAHGNAFTTDSSTRAVYWVPNGKDRLEVLVGGERFASPQGLCLSSDESKLLIADYSRGLFVLDLRSHEISWVDPTKASTTLAGIDGLYSASGSLIAIQNGVQPNRVLRISLDSALTAVVKVDVLESNHRAFGEPTLGTIVGPDLHYVANSQLGRIMENPKHELAPAIILRLRLD